MKLEAEAGSALSKGVEQGTVLRMTEVIADVLPDHRTDRIGVLTGPNLALEVALGQPAATVVAIGDGATADERDYFRTDGEVAFLLDDVRLEEVIPGAQRPQLGPAALSGSWAHGRRIGAGDLHRDRFHFAFVIGATARLLAFPQKRVRGDHFRYRQARAEADRQG